MFIDMPIQTSPSISSTDGDAPPESLTPMIRNHPGGLQAQRLIDALHQHLPVIVENRRRKMGTPAPVAGIWEKIPIFLTDTPPATPLGFNQLWNIVGWVLAQTRHRNQGRQRAAYPPPPGHADALVGRE
jgi:hypothetical protein